MQYKTEKEQPLISVIVPVYNRAKLLPRCIESILNQTHSNLELILVNDGSTDGSGDVCDEYAKGDARVRVIHQENGGESAARNTGLDTAKGEWIGQVDSDDYIDLQMYEKLLSAATLQSTLLSTCGYVNKGSNRDDTVIVFPDVPPKIAAIEVIERGVLFMHWAMLYHRKIINAPMIGSDDHVEACPLRYDTAVHRGPDSLFVIETLLRVDELAHIPEALYTWDCTRENDIISAPFGEKNMTKFIALKKTIELLEPVSPKGALHWRQKHAIRAFSAMRGTLFSESIHHLYPECRKEAKGNVRYLLSNKKLKTKRKIKFCAVYFFPRLARAAWKIWGSVKGK